MTKRFPVVTRTISAELSIVDLAMMFTQYPSDEQAQFFQVIEVEAEAQGMDANAYWTRLFPHLGMTGERLKEAFAPFKYGEFDA